MWVHISGNAQKSLTEVGTPFVMWKMMEDVTSKLVAGRVWTEKIAVACCSVAFVLKTRTKQDRLGNSVASYIGFSYHTLKPMTRGSWHRY